MAFLSIGSGHSVGYLTDQVGQGREGYYTDAVDAGEPAGVWYGRGAAELGLTGEVDADLLEAIYLHRLDPRDANTHSRSTWGLAEHLGSKPKAFRSPEDLLAEYVANEPEATPERRDELRRLAERHSQQNVAFTDWTFSPQKSVTVAALAFERAANEARAAGHLEEAADWERMNAAVEAAVMAGARASIDYLERHAAFARRGKHGGGAGKWIDAPQLTVAQFLQHDSRDHDPQLHVHQAVWNQVRGADGKYTSLDTRIMGTMRAAAEAVGGRVMEAQLAAALGWRFVPRGDGVREVEGVPAAVCDMMSKRARAITGKTAELVDEFVRKFGREPSAPDLNRIKQEATLATRAAKSHTGETRDEMLARWERETRAEVAGGLAEVARTLAGQATSGQAAPPDRWVMRDVVERAVDAIAHKKGMWSRSDLMGAVSDALPANLGIAPARVQVLLEQLTDVALGMVQSSNPSPTNRNPVPEELQRGNGDSVYDAPLAARYVAPGQLLDEANNRAAAVRRGAQRFTRAQADAVVERYREAGRPLGRDQEAALRGILTSGAWMQVLAAPAGTGKSFVVGAINDALAEHGVMMHGLAPSQVAADVLRDEGLTSANIDRWLIAQGRIARGRERDGDAEYRLAAGDVVAIDEAGMATVQQIAAVRERCEKVGASVILVGDSRQLGSVGPGGALADIGEHGVRYELTEVRRFASKWERLASLRLRDGDAAALDEYQKHGRLLARGDAEDAEGSALRGWLADTLAGRDSVLIAGTNEAAARLAARAREELARLGMLDVTGPSVQLERDGNQAGAGDLVQARRNAWDIPDRAAVNRAMYRVREVHADGSLTVYPALAAGASAETVDVASRDIGAGGTAFRLPADYVQANLTLGYAATVHAAQGRTLDTCHAVIDRTISAAAAYVALTRGRLKNIAHVVCRGRASADDPVGVTQEIEPRAARAVMGEIVEKAEDELSALQEMERAAEERTGEHRNIGQLLDAAASVHGGRTASALDQLVDEGVITADDRVRLAADEATGSAVERILRSAELAGHDRTQLLRDALRGKLTGAKSAGQVLYGRIQKKVGDSLASTITAFRDLVPGHAEGKMRAFLEERAETADTRRRELGSRLADKPEPWALEALGPVPEDVLARAEWEHRAGWAAAYREMAQWDHDTDALGSAPPAGLAEKYAIWLTAHRALDLPDAGAEERQASEGLLRRRVVAYEREEKWAPRYVADELAETERQAEARRVDAEIWAARAGEIADPDERAALVADAARARAEHEELTGRVRELEVVDAIRSKWFAATAKTREFAERARAELAARGVDMNDAAEAVTAEEWLAAHADHLAADEPVREVTVDDVAEDIDADPAAAESAQVDETEATPAEDTTADTEASPAEDTDPATAEDTTEDTESSPTEDTESSPTEDTAEDTDPNAEDTERRTPRRTLSPPRRSPALSRRRRTPRRTPGRTPRRTPTRTPTSRPTSTSRAQSTSATLSTTPRRRRPTSRPKSRAAAARTTRTRSTSRPGWRPTSPTSGRPRYSTRPSTTPHRGTACRAETKPATLSNGHAPPRLRSPLERPRTPSG